MQASKCKLFLVLIMSTAWKSFAAAPITSHSILNTSHGAASRNITHKKEHAPIHHNTKIRDVELLIDKNDSQIAKNKLLISYIDKIIELRNADARSVERYILLINKIPGYEANYLLRNTKTEKNGDKSSEMVISVQRKVVKLSLRSNNGGSADFGKYQFGGLAQLMNPIGFNDSMIVGISTTNKSGNLQILNGGYLKRLNSLGTSANILISKLKDSPSLGFNDQSLSYKAEIEHYVILNNTNTLKLEVSAQRRIIDEKGPFNTEKIASYRYNMLTAAVTVKHADALKADNSLTIQFNNTLGQAKLQSSTRTFDKNFNFFTLNFSRDQPCGEAFNIFTQILGHYSDNSLPIEQQFAVGGNVGRAYSSGLISANKALAIELELRYTKFMHSKIIDTVQPYIFIEDVFISKPQQPTSFRSLASTGLGIRFLLSCGINANIEFNTPLTKRVLIGNSSRVKNSSSLIFSISKEFKI